ncbi:hypothetical protein [Pedobacter sp. UBA5917]|jgi:hypothetical protein|uniref:hypothetical protein n=1 Tax=Pedobacter sp. UBA5917 TaxID=1947061 RepID=UPI0025EA2319|nr:hypothetical protein [Pedobacter sp. UBA5917]
MGKIQYKPLEKTLNMCLEIETSEKTALNDKYSLKVFDVNISPVKVSFWSGHQNIEVFRKPVEEKLLPNNEADAFVQEASTLLNHLTIKLDFNGVPISIEKQDELWQNWLGLRANLAASYTGDWIEKTLTEIDKKLLPNKGLLPYIMQDIFLNEYFRGVYNALFIENCFYGKRIVYGLCPSPILFNEKLILQTSPTSQLINFSGKEDKIYDQSGFSSWFKNKSNYALPQIKAEGFYQIDNVTGWCNSLESNYKLSTNDYEKTLKIVLNTN